MKHTAHRRRGSVMVLAVFLMAIMFTFVAFAIDVGYILTAETQAQRAADSAALAGAIELASQDRLTENSILDIYDAVRDEAVAFAALNRVAGDGATINRNTWNLPIGDVVLGRLDDTTDRDANLTFADWQNYNAVQVRVRRTSLSQDGQVPLFFLPPHRTRCHRCRRRGYRCPAVRHGRFPSHRRDRQTSTPCRSRSISWTGIICWREADPTTSITTKRTIPFRPALTPCWK